MIFQVILPKLGQTMETGVIVEWLKKEGDPVEPGDTLFTVESDKATLEVEATRRGFLRKIAAPTGKEIPVLEIVALITSAADEEISDFSLEENTAGISTPGLTFGEGVPEPKREQSQPHTRRLFVSPRARRIAREKGVELDKLTGSGPDGRIVEDDVLAFIQSQARATPVARRLARAELVDLNNLTGTGSGGRITKSDVERAANLEQPPYEQIDGADSPVAVEKTVSGVRAVIARRMHQSCQETAPVTLTTEVDATALVEARTLYKSQLGDRWGFTPSYNDLLILIVARALKEYTYMNARLIDGTSQQSDKVHIGLAVDTERGLLVPVIKDAGEKGLEAIGLEVRRLVERALAGKAQPDELSGGSFTITNLGSFGIDAFTPIINLPETAILGVGRIADRPAVIDGEIRARKSVWLSLTFDHRLVDGAPAARFLQHIGRLIEDPLLLLF